MNYFFSEFGRKFTQKIKRHPEFRQKNLLTCLKPFFAILNV